MLGRKKRDNYRKIRAGYLFLVSALGALVIPAGFLGNTAYKLASGAGTAAYNALRIQQVQAETMSSPNYRVQTDILSQGGGGASSTNYDADDTIGDLATGEDLLSTNYRACAGYECFGGAPFITFEVTAGLTPPGTVPGLVELGDLPDDEVVTSDGTSINSIFLTVDSNAPDGVVITVTDECNGLCNAATADVLDSVTGTLTPGSEGYGICVFDTDEDVNSPSTLEAEAPFDGNCTKTTGHEVGEVDTTPTTVLTTDGPIGDGFAEVLVKASRAPNTASGSYHDTLTFIATGTY